MYQWIQSATGQSVSVKSFLSLTPFPKWAYNLIKKKRVGRIVVSLAFGNDSLWGLQIEETGI